MFRALPPPIAFASLDQIVERLASIVELALRLAIKQHGQAHFAVSGGSTPKPLYEHLSKVDLGWEHVKVTLVDERWVQPDHHASNEKFVRATLMQHNAQAASLQTLWCDGLSHQDAAIQINQAWRQTWTPIDVAILGMGTDGHTASWFPHAHGLDGAILEDERSAIVAAITADESAVTGENVERLTLTKSALRGASAILLMISGEAKRRTYELAMKTPTTQTDIHDMPVRSLSCGDVDLSARIWPAWAPT
ncbi:MAG: 6-phosphogluconolactonase [Pseudomonadota bacterium]